MITFQKLGAIEGTAAVFAAALVVAAASPAGAASVFGTGPYTLPEGISAGPGGILLVSDLDNDAVYQVFSSGGGPIGGIDPAIDPFGTVQLSRYYGALSGNYLAYGTGYALIGPSATGPVGSPVENDSSVDYLAQAVVAPATFGSIAAGQVIFTNEDQAPLDVLSANGSSVTDFGSISDSSFISFGIAFAPTTFGADGGDIFVSGGANGEIYVLDADGNSTLFATLPLPPQSNTGLRQIAFAPAGFGALGGDLFVSVAGQNGGGGTYGAIDVLDPSGQIVAHYAEGSLGSPLDPRGLYFLSDSTLLFANADPQIIEASPSDFGTGPAAVPEPATWSLMVLGFGGLGLAMRAGGRRRVTASV
jgi:hypothetical protein